MIRRVLLLLALASCTETPAITDGGCASSIAAPADFRITRAAAGAPTGGANFRQQIRAGGCQGVQYYFVDAALGLFWRELVTNCRPDGATTPCPVDVAGGGGPSADPRGEYARRCVCCDAGRCAGFVCAPPDRGASCMPEDPTWNGPPIPEPRADRIHCDCASVAM